MGWVGWVGWRGRGRTLCGVAMVTGSPRNAPPLVGAASVLLLEKKNIFKKKKKKERKTFVVFETKRNEKAMPSDRMK